MAATGSLAGCMGLFDGDESGRVHLTVQNEGADPITVQVVVVDDEGTTDEDESDRIDSGVANTFDANCSRLGFEKRVE